MFYVVPNSEQRPYLIVRYGPFSPEGVEKNANGTVVEDRLEGREPRWGVSAFGDEQHEDETLEEAVERICRIADKRGNSVAVVTLDDLREIGLDARLDEPPLGHHLVGEGNLEKPPDYEALSDLLNTHRQKNPVGKESTR